MGAPDGAPAPGLVRGEGDVGQWNDDAPGGEAAVDGAGMAGEEGAAYGRADAVGGHHQVGLQLPVGRLHAGRPAGVARDSGVRQVRGGAGADGVGRKPPRQEVDEGGAVQQDERAAEAFGRGGRPGTGQPPAARRPQSGVALPGGQGADVVAQADDVQGAERVGGQRDRRAHRCQGGGALQHGDPRPAQVQGGRRGQPADAPADHDRPLGRCHGFLLEVGPLHL